MIAVQVDLVLELSLSAHVSQQRQNAFQPQDHCFTLRGLGCTVLPMQLAVKSPFILPW
jgi:hypothetical protein